VRALLRTIRFRLTLWYALMLALAMALFGGLTYALVRYQLLVHHDAALVAAAADALRVLAQVGDGEPVTPFQRDQLDRIGHLVLLREVGRERRVLYRSPDSVALPELAGPSLAPLAESGAGSFVTLPGRGRQLFRVYSVAYASPSGRALVVDVVEGLGDIVAPLASLRLTLFWMAPLAVVLSAAGGYWLAGRALAPVDRVTRLAREIGAGSLSRRLPVPRASDEIGRLVETLNDMIARLEASFEGMARFTADASHELRGPLATMRGAIDVALSRSRQPAEYRLALESVGEDVDRLRSITEDLLVLARADAGRLLLERSPVRLDVVAAEVVEGLAASAAARGVALSVRRPSPVLVEGDERWLRRLAFNLVDNAIKFSDASGHARPMSVAVEVELADATARLSVSDSGCGIPEDALDRIFERFYRADDSRPRSIPTEGSGLGLPIAAWIAEAHGGALTARNRPEGGSLFLATLPATA
jgi:heavy metal sensor kinase